jgi:hypothetical protein
LKRPLYRVLNQVIGGRRVAGNSLGKPSQAGQKARKLPTEGIQCTGSCLSNDVAQPIHPSIVENIMIATLAAGGRIDWKSDHKRLKRWRWLR